MTNRRRILVINGHPDAGAPHFCHALTAAYLEGADQGGHEYRRLDLAGMNIPFLRSRQAWENEPLPPDLMRAADLVAWSDHLVLIFPLWLGTMPALVKAFLEHLLRPLPGSPGGPDLLSPGRLGGKSARLIITMGMPSGWHTLACYAVGLRGLERDILRRCGACPVEQTLIGSIEGDLWDRERARENVRRLGTKGR